MIQGTDVSPGLVIPLVSVVGIILIIICLTLWKKLKNLRNEREGVGK